MTRTSTDEEALALANLIDHNCKQGEYNLLGTASRMNLIVAALRAYASRSEQGGAP